MKHFLCALIGLLCTYGVFCQPVVSSFSPTSGTVGTSVIITGSNFSSTASSNIVYFGAVRAAVTSASSTNLVVTVPAGATYKPISVTNAGLTGYSSKPFALTFAGSGNFSYNYFPNYFDSTTALNPNDATLADFDGDGKLDIATANNYSIAGQPASISVLRNTSSGGNISFASQIKIDNGVQTYAIASGDIDGDGKLDIIATSNAEKKVSIFMNTSTSGSISFAPKVDYATGDNPFSVSVADLDNDGKPEIVVTNYFSGTVRLYKNSSTIGNISLGSPTDLTTALGPNTVAIGDIDNDGKLDVVTANRLSNSVSFFRNMSTVGSLLFNGKVDFAVGSSAPYGLAIGDMDGDGKNDLMVSNLATPKLVALRNTTTGGTVSFALSTVTTSTSDGGYKVSLGDVNGDGKPDALVAGSTGFISIVINKSTAGSLSFSYVTTYTSYPVCNTVLAGDLNNDGKSDLVGTRFTSQSVAVMRSEANKPMIGSFTPMGAAASTSVDIIGENFTGTTAVSFGTEPAASYTVVSDTKITAIVGTGVSGKISVTTPYGTSSSSLGFVFYGPPVVKGFAPSSCNSINTVTIAGNNFTSSSVVKFGNVQASSFTFVTTDTLRAIPAATSASGDVSVTTGYGTGSLAGFVFLPPPSVTSFTPAAAGLGQTVTITGTNFTNATSVSFGGVNASSFAVLSPTTITAVVGNASSGSVMVTTPDGTGTKSGFSFIPTIYSFSPVNGGGSTLVTIDGANFSNVTNVSFGGVYSNYFTVVSPTKITAFVGGSGATGNVAVHTSSGTAVLGGFTFYPKPTITSFDPPIGGPGTIVTIKGTNFNLVDSVVLAASPVSSFTVNSTTEIVAILGPTSTFSAQSVNVYAAGGFATLGSISSSDQYPFVSTPNTLINSFAPLSGNVGSSVVIKGANFSTVANDNIVYFGKVRATVTSATANELVVQVPQGAAFGFISVASNNRICYSRNKFIVKYPVNGNQFTATSFSSRINLNMVRGLADVKIFDFDGDGKIDVLASLANKTLAVYRNTTPNLATSLSFAETAIPVERGVSSLTACDYDADGKLDIVGYSKGSSGYDTLVFMKNLSTPGNIDFSFAGKIGVYFAANLSNAGGAIVPGDMNNDGKLDFVVTNYGALHYHYLINTSTSNTLSFASNPPVYYSPNFTVTDKFLASAEMANFDSDAYPDLATSFDYFTGGSAWYTAVYKNFYGRYSNTYSGDYTPVSGWYQGKLHLADFNEDGKLDLWASGRFIHPNNTLSTYLSFGSIVLNNFSNFIASGNEPTAVGSLCGDGLIDLVRINYNSNQILVAKNVTSNGTIAFSNPVTLTAGCNLAISMDMGDMNGDGKADLVVGNWGDSTVSIYLNQVSGAVPLSLVDFNGNLSGGSVKLSWQTSNEVNTSHFEVEYGTDGIDFNKLGNVVSFGRVQNNYGFVHTIPVKGYNYYRLKMVDKDGKFSYSQIVKVKLDNGKLFVSPNPAKDNIVVVYPTSPTAQMKIIDALGRIVKTVSLGNNGHTATINISNLTLGMYTIVWSDGSNTESQTFIKD